MSRRKKQDDDDLDYEEIDIDGDTAMDTAGGDAAGYSWEEEYKRSWDVLQEDEQGSLQSVVSNIQQKMKRRRLLKDTATVQRGIIRHLFLVIDMSDSMVEKDLRPNRLALTLTYADQFITEFFDQNPISQLGLILTRDGIAEKLTELSGNPLDHTRALKQKRNLETSGEPSLQNALEVARASLSHVPSHASREIIIIYAALTTCDPGNIYDTVSALKRENVRVSVVGLAAEMQVCRYLTRETRGSYGIIMNESHYRDLLFELIPPPAVVSTGPAKPTANLVMMGFPTRITEMLPSLCVCHSKPTLGGYICPRCGGKVCEIPADCDICGLTLVSSPHLARSYHHLFPVQNYEEVPWPNTKNPERCFSCLTQFDPPPTTFTSTSTGATTLTIKAVPVTALINSSTTNQNDPHIPSSNRYECPKCHHRFCVDCDLFVHEVLHNCPGCWSDARSGEVVGKGKEIPETTNQKTDESGKGNLSK